MSEPLNQKESEAKVELMILRVMDEIANSLKIVNNVTEARLVILDSIASWSGFGWSESNLVELDYLNDSIIPNDKALIV